MTGARIVRCVGSRAIKRKLARTSSRLSALRRDLAVIDEQRGHLAADADDHAIRAMVAENTAASREAREARQHADAMVRHRERVVAEIDELENRQDELLDRLTAS